MASRWIALAGTGALVCAQPVAAQYLACLTEVPVFTRFAPLAAVDFSALPPRELRDAGAAGDAASVALKKAAR